tara:strand:+ start:1143 stop:1391 length:249 start_codon:yes stop_codon:yes gene_type:complete
MSEKIYVLNLTENARATEITSDSKEEMVEALRRLATCIERGDTGGAVTADRVSGKRYNPRICSFTVVHEDLEIYNQLKEATR